MNENIISSSFTSNVNHIFVDKIHENHKIYLQCLPANGFIDICRIYPNEQSRTSSMLMLGLLIHHHHRHDVRSDDIITIVKSSEMFDEYKEFGYSDDVQIYIDSTNGVIEIYVNHIFYVSFSLHADVFGKYNSIYVAYNTDQFHHLYSDKWMHDDEFFKEKKDRKLRSYFFIPVYEDHGPEDDDNLLEEKYKEDDDDLLEEYEDDDLIEEYEDAITTVVDIKEEDKAAKAA